MSLVAPLGFNEQRVSSLSEERKEPPWLRDFRVRAFQKYQASPLERSPLYSKYVDLSLIDLSKVELGADGTGTQPPPELRAIFEKSKYGSTIVQLDGRVVGLALGKELHQGGVIFTDISTAVSKYPELLERWMGDRLIPPEEDKFVALNSALFTSGFFIQIPRDTVIRTPLRLLSILNRPGTGVVNLNLILAGSGSRAEIIQEAYTTVGSGGPGQSLFSEVTEIVVDEGSRLGFSSVQSLGQDVVCLINRRATVGDSGMISWASGIFGGRTVRSRLDSRLQGVNATAEDVEVAFGTQSQRFDIVSDLTHLGQHTRGTILARSVLKEKARSILKGMIRIDQRAKHSEAYLAEHAMLMSREARADAVPGLEIETNEVKATHSASVAQIDDEQVFYLMSRGLSEDEAKKMIVTAFFEPAIYKIPLPSVRLKTRYLLEEKWGGTAKVDLLALDDIVSTAAEEEAARIITPEEFFEKHYKYGR